MSRLLATVTVLVCVAMAQASITASFVPVPECGTFCYDIVVTVTDDPGNPDDWTACGMTVTLTGDIEFINDETYNPPCPSVGMGDPYDSYFTDPSLYPNDPNAVGQVTFTLPDIVIEEPQLRFAEWYDWVDTGAGTFVLSRLRMQTTGTGWAWWEIDFEVAAANTGGYLFPFHWEAPFGPYCLADLDDDGYIGLSDLAQLLANYGMTSGAVRVDGDMNGDGDVDLEDLARLLSSYGTECP